MKPIGRNALCMVGSALALAGCTAQSDSPTATPSARAGQCFFPSQVSGFTSAGRDRIHVHTGPNQVFLFETFARCPDLDFSENLGFEHRGGGAICSGLDVDLIVPSTIGPQRCPVRMIRKLSREEAQASRRKNHP